MITARIDSAAECVADEVLQLTGRALLARDFDMFASAFLLPKLIETREGRRYLRTRDDLREVFDSVTAYMAAQGVRDLVRTVVSAEFRDADTVAYTHVSLLMCQNGEAIRPPYPSFSILKRDGLEWKVVSSIYAILDCEEHSRAILAGTYDEIVG